MSDLTTYTLRMPRSLRQGVSKLAKEDGVSVNQFVNIAVAEKLAVLQTQHYFRQRAKRADLTAFDRLMARTAGEKPRAGDESR